MSQYDSDSDRSDVECPTCGRTDFSNTRGMKCHHKLAHGESIAGIEVSCAHCGASKRVSRLRIENRDHHFCGVECHSSWVSESTGVSAAELEHLYWDEEMSMVEIGDRLGCSTSTVHRKMKEHGIPHRERSVACRLASDLVGASFGADDRGYEYTSSRFHCETDRIRLHRLAAIAWFGVDAVKDKVVHHCDPEGKGRPGIPWDNREEILQPMDTGEHARLHNSSTYDGDVLD